MHTHTYTYIHINKNKFLCLPDYAGLFSKLRGFVWGARSQQLYRLQYTPGETKDFQKKRTNHTRANSHGIADLHIKHETVKQMNQNAGGFVISDYKGFYRPQKQAHEVLLYLLQCGELTRWKLRRVPEMKLTHYITTFNINKGSCFQYSWISFWGGKTAKQMTAKKANTFCKHLLSSYYPVLEEQLQQNQQEVSALFTRRWASRWTTNKHIMNTLFCERMRHTKG